MVNKLLYTTILLSSLSAWAKGPGLPPLPPETVNDYGKIPDAYLGEQNPVLSPLEKQALAIGNQWRNPGKHQSVAPSQGKQGFIQFIFGASQPRVVCAVLQVCDIALHKVNKFLG